MTSSLYATNVAHYDYVLQAMFDAFDDVSLVRRFEPTPLMVERMRRYRFPSQWLKILERRVRDAPSIPTTVNVLGLLDLLPAATARTGFNFLPNQPLRVSNGAARTVADAGKGADLLHFVEGLGHLSLRRNEHSWTICERRAHHHGVYEQEVEPLAGFPWLPKKNAIRHILEFEYSHSDYIHVYSEAAKRSFTSRGHAADKVVVSPIGVAPRLPPLPRIRRDRQLAYVGRGDLFKGLDLAVATRHVLGGDFSLQVAGPMNKEILRWLDGQEGVKYLGILNAEELRELYSTSTALLAPSQESFGLAIADAVHHGLPVFCSDGTGISEYLSDLVCRVVPGREPALWAEAIVAGLESEFASGNELARAHAADADLAAISPSAASVRLALHYRAITGRDRA